MIYLDNAATSFRKPDSVYQAVDHAMRHCSGNPGRAGHKVSLLANDIVRKTRLLCATLFNAERAEQIVFCANATEALNLAIKGILHTGDHVVTTSMEHNSVARPLEAMKMNGVEITKVASSPTYGVDPESIRKNLKDNTRLVIATHVSNVTGTVNDIAEIGRLCREHGIPFLVDAAQSAGARLIDVQDMNIDLLAFPGHKSLLGPQGTGGLYVRKGIKLKPLKEGGTGSSSESLEQPDSMPEGYESGTLNVPGIAGLGAGISFIADTGIEEIQKKEDFAIRSIVDGLLSLRKVSVYGPPPGHPRGAVISFNIEGMGPQDVAILLDAEYGIAVRGGLHCSPDAHRTIGTLLSGGTVRVSPNYFTETEEIESFIKAVEMVVNADD